MIGALLFNRWGLLFVASLLLIGWANGAGDAFERAFPGFGSGFLDHTVTLVTSILTWLAGVVFVPWDALADRLPLDERYAPMVTRWMHSLWGHAIWVLVWILLINALIWHRHSGHVNSAAEQNSKRGRTQRPARVPFVDEPSRALPVGKDRHGRQVRANIAQSNVFIAAGTGSGKTAVMRHLADADETADLFGLFDVSLPTLARMRRWQEQARQGNLPGPDGRPRPVIVWRPNPHNVAGWPKLQLCGGPALEAISRIQHAIRESAGSTGDQRGKARDVGVEIFLAADRANQVRCFDMLIEGWRRESLNQKRDREVRVACARWASKVAAVKSMLGSAEGPDGINPLEVCARHGKLAMEINNFAVADAASAFGPLILGLFIWLVDASPVPVTVGFDEGNQLGDYADDLIKIFTACRGRDGRACLCSQRPWKFKEVAPNADVVIIGGFGPAATREREWAADTSGLDRDDFKKHERNVAGRLLRRINHLDGLMNLECYVVHEGVTEGIVTIDNPYPEMKRYLRHVDWPRNRARIAVPNGILEPDPDEDPDPLPPDGGMPWNGKAPHSVPSTAATRKVAAIRREQREAVRARNTGTIDAGSAKAFLREERTVGMSLLQQGPPEAWVQSPDARRWWTYLNGTHQPGTSRAVWLWTGAVNKQNGRPKSSRVITDAEWARLRLRNPNAKKSQSCQVFPELYEEAGYPNGKPFPGSTYDHLSHTRDETCPGGSDCIHRLDCNPWNIEPVSMEEQIQRRDAQRARHNEWRITQGLEPLASPIEQAGAARIEAA